LRWLAIAALAAASAALVAKVAADHVVATQVVAAIGGALLTVGGAATVAVFWPARAESEWRSLAAAGGFFAASLGVFTMAAGAGLFH
jgi:hypothetical protein